MANESSFAGTVSFPIECYDTLMKYISQYKAPYYGVGSFHNTRIDGDCIYVDFLGNVRWSAEGMFSNDGSWFFYPDENPIANQLIHELDGREIELNYVDLEPGCEVFYEFYGSINIDNGCVDICGACEDIPYTSRNMVDYGCFDLAATTDNVRELIDDYFMTCKIDNRDKIDWSKVEALAIKMMQQPRYDGVLCEYDEYDFMYELEEEINAEPEKYYIKQYVISADDLASILGVV